ncbi:MAG: FKBP-type peptidyl-prolyl cis-trans isomerase [Thermoplasmata archaeon]|nr:FKBP-type peptidyl-prolyl cis-trans isomerase [Thermoplasmata archaeon]MCI4360008.1 FKBP-type peptidyl-prolyl cis-trans isomerase [Thermoplasmata archaeon]
MAQPPSVLPMVVLVAIVLVAAGGTGAYLYVHNAPKPASALPTVRQGDNVTVNYIGTFGSGPEQGKVFDTSIYDVSTQNSTYPKALQFHSRGGTASYTPLAVHVGSGTPSQGYSFANQSFIQVVTGFWEGLVGLPGNQTHAVVVPPSLGYGATNPACVRSLPLTVRLPVFETIPGPRFSKLYPGVVATTGAQFRDPTYGWTTQIFSANQTSVSLQNFAYVGETFSLQGWPAQVTNLTTSPNGSGQITVVNELTPDQVGHIAGHSATGLCTSQSNGNYILTAVNYTSGTFTEDFDQEVVGQTLIFQVTVVNIYHPFRALV